MLIGIDLGTTNSLAAVWRDGKAELVPNPLGEFLTPSVVSLSDNNEILTGRAARDRLISHPDLTAANFKRYMGTNKTLNLGDKQYRPEELSALILGALKRDIEEYLGEKITGAIVTVPAYFRDAQRKATRLAGEMAGLKVDRLLNEPTAAALAYGLQDLEREVQFLVFDLGGGTFDVSILELFDGVMEVRAGAGDNHLGGEDFLDVLLEHSLKNLKVNKEELGKKSLNSLRKRLELAKRKLTESEQTTIKINHKDTELEYVLSRATFRDLCAELLDRIRKPAERALRDADIRAADLEEVILVGGASRMPLIRELAAKMFGRLPAVSIQPDQAIALGAAVQAGLRMKDAALEEVVLTDVSPFTLGVEVAEETTPGNITPGIFLPIIERNTVIPCSRVHTVSTLNNWQTKLDVVVYQGESRRVIDNTRLGRFTVTVPRKRAGEESVNIRFTYDASGILEVEAEVLSQKKKFHLVIEENPGYLSDKEIEKILKKLSAMKIHPRDKDQNAAMLARAERMYEENLGEKRRLIGHFISLFESSLETQDPAKIEDSRQELKTRLDELEGEAYL